MPPLVLPVSAGRLFDNKVVINFSAGSGKRLEFDTNLHTPQLRYKDQLIMRIEDAFIAVALAYGLGSTGTVRGYERFRIRRGDGKHHSGQIVQS